MKNHSILIILVLLFGCIFLGAQAGGDEQKGRARALIIGINDYTAKPLPYALNDAKEFEKTLRNLGVSDITTLYDRKASKENMLQAMKNLTSGCNESDIFIMFYSGHGTWVPDQNGDEKDGMDEGLVAVDSKGLGVLVADDEIDNALNNCKAKLVLTIFDSCHSGGTAKSIYSDQTNRFLPIKDVKYSLADAEKPYTSGEKKDSFGILSDQPTNPNEIVFTGAKSDELGWEYGSLKHGVFSYYLIDALTRSAPKVDTSGDGYLSFGEIYKYCYNKVYSYATVQHPTCYISDKLENSRGIFKLNPDGSVIIDIPGTEPVVKPPKNQIVNDLASAIEAMGNCDKPRYVITTNSNKSSYNPEDEVNLTVNVDANCYLYLLNVFYEDQVQIVFPNFNSKQNLVNAGAFNTSDTFLMDVDPESKAGTEYVLVIASPIKLDLESLLDNPLSREYVFGEISHHYGSRGGCAVVVDKVELKCKKLRVKEKVDGQVADKSVTVGIIEYQVL